MNYEKRYNLQKKINEDLQEKISDLEEIISELKEDNERLSKENDWYELIKDSNNEQLKESIETLEKIKKDFQDGLDEIRETKKKLDTELKEAQKEHSQFKEQWKIITESLQESLYNAKIIRADELNNNLNEDVYMNDHLDSGIYYDNNFTDMED